jgi:hypothetical protein
VKKQYIIIIAVVAFLLIVLMILGGSQALSERDQTTNMSVSSFSNRDKKAGGTYAAFKMLPQLFASHSVQVVTKPFEDTYKKEPTLQEKDNVYILVAEEMYTTAKDLEAMLYYVRAGNDLFLAVNKPDPLLEKEFGFTVVESSRFQGSKVGFVEHYLDPAIPHDTSFNYNGMVTGNYISGIDSTSTMILGYNYKNKPNFIKIAYGGGFIYLLLNPYTFSNYFLMHEKNVAALETQLSYLHYDPANVYWDDYYNRIHNAQSRGSFSDFQALMRYPAMRWAVWLSLILAALFMIFESKRRQRIVPDRPAMANNSLEFVDAIGQLYFQQHNNQNLTHKMILHFMEYIRTRYNLDTNVLNDEFIGMLSRKSAVPENDIRTLLQMMQQVQQETSVSDEYLKEFYSRIQQFYLNTK